MAALTVGSGQRAVRVLPPIQKCIMRLTALLLPVVPFAAGAAPQGPAPADLVITDAKIYTADRGPLIDGRRRRLR